MSGYGKFFSSCFTGSMVGAGSDVFAVWGYVIANVFDGQVELNPVLLSAVIGTPVERVEQAIEALCAPDPRSRNKSENGSRLMREGQFAYRVVSHEIYRAMRNEDERREYNKLKQREYRSAKKANKTRGVNDSVPQSAYTEADTYAEADTKADLTHHHHPIKDGGESEKGFEEPSFTASNPENVPPLFGIALSALKRSWAENYGHRTGLQFNAQWFDADMVHIKTFATLVAENASGPDGAGRMAEDLVNGYFDTRKKNYFRWEYILGHEAEHLAHGARMRENQQ